MRIRHLNPIKMNFTTKLVTPTAHKTSQKPKGSILGFRKIRLCGGKEITQGKRLVHRLLKRAVK